MNKEAHLAALSGLLGSTGSQIAYNYTVVHAYAGTLKGAALDFVQASEDVEYIELDRILSLEFEYVSCTYSARGLSLLMIFLFKGNLLFRARLRLRVYLLPSCPVLMAALVSTSTALTQGSILLTPTLVGVLPGERLSADTRMLMETGTCISLLPVTHLCT